LWNALVVAAGNFIFKIRFFSSHITVEASKVDLLTVDRQQSGTTSIADQDSNSLELGKYDRRLVYRKDSRKSAEGMAHKVVLVHTTSICPASQ
jgi:hypothetical protein